MDSPAKEWIKGSDPVKPHRPIDLRTMKAVRRSYLIGSNDQNGDVIHYIYALHVENSSHLEVVTAAARSITHLGWGIDMAVGDASVISAEQVAQLEGVRRRPLPAGGTPLRAQSRCPRRPNPQAHRFSQPCHPRWISSCAAVTRIRCRSVPLAASANAAALSVFRVA